MRSPSFYVCSPPSGGRFWYRVPSEEQGKGPPERTKRVGAVSRTEDASGAEGGFHAPGTPENASRTSGGCPQSVESAVLWAFDASRTRRGCFWHGTPLNENASRTTGGLFAHRAHIPYRKSLFLVPSPHTEAGCHRSGAGCHVSGEIIKS